MVESRLLRVYFPGVLISDIVRSIGSGSYDNDLLVEDLPTINPQFYLEKDTDGTTILATIKTDQQPLSGDFDTAGTVVAIPMISVDFIGGRPNDRFPRPHKP